MQNLFHVVILTNSTNHKKKTNKFNIFVFFKIEDK